MATVYLDNDTYVSEEFPIDNYDTQEYLTASNNVSTYDKYLLLDFDFSSEIGNGKTIESARLYMRLTSGATITGDIEVYAITSSYTSSTVVYNTMPTLSTEKSSDSISYSSGAWYSIDISSILQDVIDETVNFYGFCVKMATSGDTMGIYSKEKVTAGVYTPYIEYLYTGFKKICIDFDDTFVRSNSPTTNYDTASSIELDYEEEYGLIKPDFSDLIGNGYTIISAVLTARVNSTGYSPYITVRNITEDWTSSTVTYNTRPTTGANTSDSVLGAVGEINIDITSLVQDIADEDVGNYGLQLEVSAGYCGIDSKYYSGTKPYITVYYTVSEGTHTKIEVSNDTYLNGYNDTTKSTNYNSNTILYFDDSTDDYVLLDFDLSSLIGNGFTVEKAVLGFVFYNSDKVNNLFTVKAITESWTPSTVTWNTKPSLSTESVTGLTYAASSSYLYEDIFDITSLIQAILDEDVTYYGLSIEETNGSDSNSNIQSKENTSGKIPYLSLEYTVGGTVNYKTITVNVDGSINKIKQNNKILAVNCDVSILKLIQISKSLNTGIDNVMTLSKTVISELNLLVSSNINILTPFKKVLEIISYIDLNNVFIKNSKINISQSINLSSILVKKGFLSILSSIDSVNNKTIKATRNIIDLASIDVGINLRNIYRRTLNAYFNILELRSNKVLKTNNSNLDLSLVMFKNNSKYINLETDLVPNINKSNKLFLTNILNLSLIRSLKTKKEFLILINSSLNLVKKIFYIIESIVDALVNVQKSTSNIIYQNLSSFLDLAGNNSKKIKKTANIDIFSLTDLTKKTHLSMLSFFDVANARQLKSKLFLTNSFDLSLIRSLKIVKIFSNLIDGSLNLVKNIKYILSLIIDTLVNVQKTTSNIIYQSLTSFLDVASNNLKKIKKTTNINVFSLTGLQKKTQLSLSNFVDSFISLINKTSKVSNHYLNVSNNNLKKARLPLLILVDFITSFINKTSKVNNCNANISNNNLKKIQLFLLSLSNILNNFTNKTGKINNCNTIISNNNLKKINLNRIINLNLFVLLNKKINKVTEVTIEVINAITLLPSNVSVFYKTITSNILLSSSKNNKIKRIIVGHLSTLADVIKKINKSINEFIGIVSNHIRSNTIYVIARYIYYSEAINKIFYTEIKNAIFYYGDDRMDSFTKQSSEKFKIELNFEASFETGETISSYDLTIYNVRNQSEIDVTSSVSESPSNDDSSVYVTIKNGTNGYWYKITVEITTTKGNIYEKDVLFNVQEK